VKTQEQNGIVTEIEIEDRDSLFSADQDEWVYEVILFNDGEYTRSYIHPDTNKVIASKKLNNWNPINWDDNIDVENFNSPEVTLSQAISAVETKLSAKAVEAELDEDHGIYFYEIKALSDTGVLNVRVSPVDGELRIITDGHDNGE
jgi:uncharacterized membrane protein YkoI